MYTKDETTCTNDAPTIDMSHFWKCADQGAGDMDPFRNLCSPLLPVAQISADTSYDLAVFDCRKQEELSLSILTPQSLPLLK